MFTERKCGEGEDVEAWVNQVQAQYRELKLLSSDLETLCINVLLNGLPDRFASFVDSIWKAEENPSIEGIKIEILRVYAWPLNRPNTSAFAARTGSLSLNSSADTSLKAFYGGLKQSGKKPSKEYHCARCGSPNHWVVHCSKSMESNENPKKKKQGKSDNRGETASLAQANKPNETAAFVSDVVTSFTTNSVEHLLFTFDSHLALVARSDRWIIESGASEYITGDK
jgi:hypothetical protein